MSQDFTLDIDTSILGVFKKRPLDLSDLEAVRLVLSEGSVIDWNRARFSTLQQVDNFLRLHTVDPSDPSDRQRLHFVHREAIVYLEDHLKLSFPDELRDPADVRSIFLLASQTGGFRRRQILACAILKLMHVINHLEAAELRFQTSLSDAEVLDLAERRIIAASVQMRSQGFPLVAFYGNRKTRNSLITKLLAKKENTAATIFDKLRFRIVTEHHSHLVPAIAWMTRNLFPFNYVIPGQTHNNLVGLDSESLARYLTTENDLPPIVAQPSSPPSTASNPFSGGSYKIVNFIVDFPVRVDHVLNFRGGTTLGRCVYALVEFQVLDATTAKLNEEGENAHHLYKDRQRAIVEKRLKKGGRWQRQRRGVVELEEP